MKYNGVVEKKLRLLEKKLAEIESWNIRYLDQLNESSMLSNALERALQVSVEIMIDVSERILAIAGIPPKDAASENMESLAELKVLENPGKYMDMVRFRNFIVHRYEYIDLNILFDIAHNKLQCFRDFIAEVRRSGKNPKNRKK